MRPTRLLKSDVRCNKNVPCLPLAMAAQFFRDSQKSDILASEVGGRDRVWTTFTFHMGRDTWRTEAEKAPTGVRPWELRRESRGEGPGWRQARYARAAVAGSPGP